MGKKKEKRLPSVASRTTRHPLKIKSELQLKDGLRIQGKKGQRTKDHAPIKLELKISRDDIERLHSLILGYPDYFLKGFQIECVIPGLSYMEKGARGRFKGKGTTLFWLKAGAAELYHLFSFLIKTGKRPSYFKRLLEKIDKLGNKEQFYTARGTLDPIALTAYCIEEYLKETNKNLQHLGIKSPLKRIEEGELEGFYKHQIKGHKSLFDYKKDVSNKDLEDLSKEPPFSYIFKLLKLV